MSENLGSTPSSDSQFQLPVDGEPGMQQVLAQIAATLSLLQETWIGFLASTLGLRQLQMFEE